MVDKTLWVTFLLPPPPPIARTQIVVSVQIDRRKINIEMQCSDYSCFKIIHGINAPQVYSTIVGALLKFMGKSPV